MWHLDKPGLFTTNTEETLSASHKDISKRKLLNPYVSHILNSVAHICRKRKVRSARTQVSPGGFQAFVLGSVACFRLSCFSRTNCTSFFTQVDLGLRQTFAPLANPALVKRRSQELWFQHSELIRRVHMLFPRNSETDVGGIAHTGLGWGGWLTWPRRSDSGALRGWAWCSSGCLEGWSWTPPAGTGSGWRSPCWSAPYLGTVKNTELVPGVSRVNSIVCVTVCVFRSVCVIKLRLSVQTPILWLLCRQLFPVISSYLFPLTDFFFNIYILFLRTSYHINSVFMR